MFNIKENQNSLNLTNKPNNPPNFFTPKHKECSSGPGSEYLKNYINLQVFLWMKNGESFWFFPTEIDLCEVYGYIWNGYQWTDSVIELDHIDCLY